MLGFCVWSLFCYSALYVLVLQSFYGEERAGCLVLVVFMMSCVAISVLWLLLVMPWVGLQCVIVVFPDHTHLRFCFSFVMREFMLSPTDNNQGDVIEAFNSTTRYQDDLVNIDNPHFEHLVDQIYPTEFRLNKTNSCDTEAPFLDLDSSI